MVRRHMGLFVCGGWVALLLFLWPQLLFETHEGIFSGAMTLWSDWSAHFTYASHLAYHPMSQWTTNHPLFLGTPFNYPFATHLFSALLLRMGIGHVNAHLLPTMAFMSGLVVFLFLFYKNCTGSFQQAAAGLSLALLGGSLGFVRTLPAILASDAPLKNLFFPPETLHLYPELHLEVGGTFSTLLIPQRTLQLGIFLGMSVLYCLQLSSQAEFNSRKRVLLGSLWALVWAVLPSVHIHSFVAVSITVGIFHLFHFKQLKHLAPFFLIGFLGSVSVLYGLHRQGNYESFLAWQPFWLAGNSAEHPIHPLLFWWLNWSMFLPLAFLGLWRCKSSRNCFVITGLVLFISVNFIRFQPWDWDNTKLLLWSYMLLIPSAIAYLSQLWNQKSLLNKTAVIVLFAGMILTGGLDLMRLLHGRKIAHVMYTREQLSLAQEFKNILKPNDVVLVAPSHHEWVSALSGGQILLGYEGWLWTYGINYSGRLEEIGEMLSGGPLSLNLIGRYGVRYAVFDSSTASKYNEQFFKDRFKRILVSPSIRVYQLNNS